MRIVASPIKAEVTRVVEGQSYIATRQLVDSNEEQEVLEQLLDSSKPPYPEVQGIDTLDYLLKTPFRYPPLPYGSRFGSQNEPGIFYASLELATALGEAAYYRFQFLLDSEAQLRPSVMQHTSFVVMVNSRAGLDLTQGIWKKVRNKISNPADHLFSQEIGTKARDNGIEVILYHSARVKNGHNVAVLVLEALVGKKISHRQHWNAYVDESTITFSRNEGEEVFVFERASIIEPARLR
jgi:hypothetical protein